MSHTLQELSETIYLDVADKVLDELENRDYTTDFPPVELRTILAKLIKNTITGNVTVNRIDPPQPELEGEGCVDGWTDDLLNQM